MSSSSYKIGDLIRPADGTGYRGEIIFVSKEQDVIRHRCLKTGKVYEKSYFGFFCRYCTLDEFDQREEDNRKENLDIINELESKAELNDMEKSYLESLKKITK